MHRNPLRPHILTLATLASVATIQAQAQQVAAAPKADDAQLQQVTVTATRRAEPLQKVPVAISVVDGQALEQANLNTLGAVTSQVPSLEFRTNASNKDTSLFVRGVGTISTSPGVEPTVSTVVDGVVLARPGQASLDLLDVDRIEVLRGPQGTLFGRNASAGVISIVTKAPSKALERYIDVSFFGGGNERRLRGGVSGELSPGGPRASVSALVGKFDGNVTNVFNGASANGYEKKGLRGKLEIDATPAVKITLGADYLRSADTVPTGVITRTSLIAYPSGTVTESPAFAAALAPVQATDSNRQINSNFDTHVDDTNRGVSATVDWNLGAGRTLTSVTAYRTWDNTQYQDGDRLSAFSAAFPQSHDKGIVAFKQVTQELRLASPGGQALDYVFGLFLLDGKNDEVYRRDVTRITAEANQSDSGVADYGTKTRSAALFGESTYRFTPALRGVLGLRYTQDNLDFRHQRSSTQDTAFPGVQPAVANTGSTSAHGTTARIGPQFDFTPDISGYATYSRGYKGPAFNVFFNMLARDTLALAPETSDSYELGLKSDWLSRRLRVNLAVFSNQYKNYQANFFDLVSGAVVTRLINAGDVSSKGVELDIVAKPVSALTLGAAVANIKARIDNFNCPAGAATSCQVNGQPLPYAPDWKGNVRAAYRLNLDGGLGLELSTDYRWQSKVQYDIGQFADTIQPAYGIWNASAALSSAAGWRVALLAKNLGDKSYASFLARGGTYVNRAVPRDDQRYFGIHARYDF
jgi:iron complex outermembrane receptor protein